MVALNAGFCLYLLDYVNLIECFEIAKKQLISGKVLLNLNMYAKATKNEPARYHISIKKSPSAEDKKTQSIDFFIENFNQKRNSGNFFSTLDGNRSNFKIIAETKKGSPSAGIIKDQYDPLL